MNSILKTITIVFLLSSCLGISVVMGQDNVSTKFEATGPTQPIKFDRSQFRGAVKVTFDLIPTTMSFDLPWTYAMVNQQGVRFSTLAAETYDPRDFALYLAPTSLGPITGEVKKLADEITRGKKGILAKARAIYDWTVDNTYRDPETRGCGVGDVTALLRRPGGKCADISSIYIALARAAGVPTREILGIRTGKKNNQTLLRYRHRPF